MAALLIALFRQQFTLLGWALFFLLIATLLLIAHLIGYLYLRLTIASLTIIFPFNVDQGVSIPFTVRLGSKVKLLPIFNYYIIIQGRAKRAFFSYSTPLIAKAQQLNALTFEKRAVYDLYYYVEAIDLFGFFSHKVKGLNRLAPLSVMPLAPCNSSITIALPHALEGQVALSKLPTDERFDSRKYYPGDDSRLINWHQVSRFNQFFIKMEERGGGFSNTIVITLLIAPYQKGSEERLDCLINYLVTLTAQLSMKGSSCQVIIGNDSIEHFDGSIEQHRLLLSPYFTGQPLMMKMDQHLGRGVFILMGDMHDSNYLEMARRYAPLKPLLISLVGDVQHTANFKFLTETFGLEVTLV